MPTPLSRFELLADFNGCNNKGNHALGAFKTFAIIVHDPNNGSIPKTIANARERIGNYKKFSFISFWDRPESLIKPEYSTKDILEFDYGCDDELFMSRLRTRFNLPTKPLIILTNNLDSANYRILICSKGNIVDKLESIARISAQFTYNTKEFNDKIEDLGSTFSLSTEDDRSIAANLTDLIAVRSVRGAEYIQNEDTKNHYRKVSLDWARKSLKRLKKTYLKLRESNDNNKATGLTKKALMRYTNYLAFVTDERNVLNANMGTANEPTAGNDQQTSLKSAFGWSPYLSTQKVKVQNTIQPEPAEPAKTAPTADSEFYKEYRIELDPQTLEDFEPISRTALINYNLLLSTWNPDPQRNTTFEFLKNNIELDYSPLAAALGNIIEEEVNASIIEFIRLQLGIPMPDYYKIYHGGDNYKYKISTGSRIINIDAKDRDVQIRRGTFARRTTPIGDTSFVIRQLIDYSGSISKEEMGVLGTTTFTDDLLNFGNLRNKAAHPGVLSLSDFKRMHASFWKVLNDYKNEIITMKRNIPRTA